MYFFYEIQYTPFFGDDSLTKYEISYKNVNFALCAHLQVAFTFLYEFLIFFCRLINLIIMLKINKK